MAQQFGTAATFGLTFETGIITDGLTYNYSNENKVLRNGSARSRGS